MEYPSVKVEYSMFRKAVMPLSTLLANLLTPDELKSAAAELGLYNNNTFTFDSDEEMSVLMDYAIHRRDKHGKNVIDRFLDSHRPPENSLELTILKSMQKAVYEIIMVDEVIEGVGVWCSNYTGIKKFVADVGFGSTAKVGGGMASRLFSPTGEWWMTGGAAMPMLAEGLKIFAQTSSAYENRHGRQATGAVLERMIITACLNSGAARRVAYAGSPDMTPAQARQAAARHQDNDVAEPLTSERIGRNEPCPCGSGKKYKKCCGK